MKMTDEDEIDILGDFTLDNFLSKDNVMFDHSNLVSQNTDILNCDYTIHPQWLLDKPSANPACWYNTSTDVTSTLSSDSSSYSFEPNNCNDNIIEPQITDKSGWTDKEKDLLKRGIEIFGKSHTRLAQFIGSKSALEIKHFLKNYYSNVEFTCSNNIENEIVLENCQDVLSSDEVIDDTEIPASIEEVIASVTTAKPTVLTKKSKSNVNYRSEASKSSYEKEKFLKHTNKNIKGKKSKNIPDGLNSNKKGPKGLVKFKFKTNLTLNSTAGKLKQNVASKNVQTESEPSIRQAEIVTGVGLSVPICSGEEVIKIQKVEQGDESDVEIDIEDLDSTPVPKPSTFPKSQLTADKTIDFKNTNNTQKDIRKEDTEDLTSKTLINRGPDLNEVSTDVKAQLNNMDIPQEEVKLDLDKIDDLEKVIHYEFFEDRPTKTPARYLKIRNHILNVWMISKPLHITKTSTRKGLQQCGDVNCIGRIHSYLEQIGAINFGCPQTSYIRPLSKLIYIHNKEKANKDLNDHIVRTKLDVSRPRIKIKTLNNGEGGCTITHNEFGEVINRMVVNEEPAQKTARINIKKHTIKLTYCRPFNDQKPQKFSIHLHLSALLLMDLHAHMSFNEVMGLVGGRWDNEHKRLIISRYEACKNIAPSSTHCDMCPVTQSNATNIFHNEDLQVLGWYHSHPTFAPEPSQQDLDTQSSVQQWIGNDKPCIGVILSPFSLHGALIASPYRCMIVDKKENFEDQYVPYRFKVDVISNNIDVDILLNRAWKLFHIDNNLNQENRINFNTQYFQDKSLSHLEKFISSVKMHLAKCSDISKTTFDSIVEGLGNVCCNKSLTSS